MNITKLFDWTYLTQRYAVEGFSWPMRIVLLIIFIAAIITALKATKKIKTSPGIYKPLWQKLQVWGWSTGLFGLLLIFFREVRAIYLGSRIWLLIWLIAVVIWLGFIIYYWKIKIPLKEQKQNTQAEFDKRLPKKKN